MKGVQQLQQSVGSLTANEMKFFAVGYFNTMRSSGVLLGPVTSPDHTSSPATS